MPEIVLLFQIVDLQGKQKTIKELKLFFVRFFVESVTKATICAKGTDMICRESKTTIAISSLQLSLF